MILRWSESQSSQGAQGKLDLQLLMFGFDRDKVGLMGVRDLFWLDSGSFLITGYEAVVERSERVKKPNAASPRRLPLSHPCLGTCIDSLDSVETSCRAVCYGLQGDGKWQFLFRTVVCGIEASCAGRQCVGAVNLFTRMGGAFLTAAF